MNTVRFSVRDPKVFFFETVAGLRELSLGRREKARGGVGEVR